MAITTHFDGAIAEVVWTDHSVNVRQPAWFELAEAITAAGRRNSVCVVVLRAEGRGFNAGVDLKACQASDGHDELLAVIRACLLPSRRSMSARSLCRCGTASVWAVASVWSETPTQ